MASTDAVSVLSELGRVPYKPLACYELPDSLRAQQREISCLAPSVIYYEPSTVDCCDLCREAIKTAPTNCICGTCVPGSACLMVLAIRRIVARGLCLVKLADSCKEKGYGCSADFNGRHNCPGCILGCLAYDGACYLDIVYYYPERYDTPRDAATPSN